MAQGTSSYGCVAHYLCQGMMSFPFWLERWFWPSSLDMEKEYFVFGIIRDVCTLQCQCWEACYGLFSVKYERKVNRREMRTKPILTICDREAVFTEKLADVFRGKKELPFEIYEFTNKDACKEFCQNNRVDIAIISEQDIFDSIEEMRIPLVLVLQESGNEQYPEFATIRKFQSAGAIYREVMDAYAKLDTSIVPMQSMTREPKLIGVYSPVHRCLQTTVAMTMGHVFSQTGRTLYLNFECFSGFEMIMGDRMAGNLTDLMYYYGCAKEKLSYHLESVVRSVGGLDMIPPGNGWFDYESKPVTFWKDFIVEVAKAGNYEYVVLDLTEQVRGLFDILRTCDKVFMIGRDDPMSKAKIAQYELVLSSREYQDVMDKTQKVKMPQIMNLGSVFENMSNPELVTYVKTLIREEK